MCRTAPIKIMGSIPSFRCPVFVQIFSFAKLQVKSNEVHIVGMSVTVRNRRTRSAVFVGIMVALMATVLILSL
jgi:hypothetical protein